MAHEKGAEEHHIIIECSARSMVVEAVAPWEPLMSGCQAPYTATDGLETLG